MIQNGILTYSNSLSPFLWWEPQHPILNTLFIGLLTTFLSLQATSLVLDFFFGVKNAGQVILSDLHSLLLVWSSSPRAIRDAISNRGCLTHHFFESVVSKDSPNDLNKNGIRKRVVAKLFLLLISGPLISIAAVAIVHERETILTIRESGLGGLAWGLNPDLSVAESHQFTEKCKQYNISTGFHDQSLVEFTTCDLPFLFEFNENATKASVLVTVWSQSEFAVAASISGWTVSAPMIPQLFTEGTLFKLKNALTVETASALVDKGIEMIAEECTDGDEQNIIEEELSEAPDFEVIYSKTISCRGPLSETEALEKLMNITGVLREYFTLVNAENLELFVRDENTLTVSAVDPATIDGISFLIRRQRNLSVVLISIVTVFLFGLRILTMFFLNNDLSLAVELAVKRELGIGVLESLLQDGMGHVSYGDCSMNVENASPGFTPKLFWEKTLDTSSCESADRA